MVSEPADADRPPIEPLPALRLTAEDAARLIRRHFDLDGSAVELPSYIDQNFRLTTDGGEFVVRFAHVGEDPAHVEFEMAVRDRIAESATLSRLCPAGVPSRSGEKVVRVACDPGGGDAGTGSDGVVRLMRVETFLPGDHLASVRPFASSLLREFGSVLGSVDAALVGFSHPGMHRDNRWDLRRASFIASETRELRDLELRAIVEHFCVQFMACVEPRIPELRHSVIHNDANDYNVLVGIPDGVSGDVSGDVPVGGAGVTGLLDYGDAVYSCTVFNVVIAATYVALDAEDPIGAVCDVLAGYHRNFPLTEQELAVVFPSLCMRLCVSAIVAQRDAATHPDNEYISISQASVRRGLHALRDIDPLAALGSFRQACGFPVENFERLDTEIDGLIARRDRVLGRSLSVSYRNPLKIVRGEMQYLFDDHGRGYVDGVNNVCHVGHCHPRVVAAACEQIGKLNTNTRYLHDNIIEYAERLTALFPDPLSVCFFVCSGSEANELAMRMARAHTGREDMVVVDVAYHGNTSGLVDLSPYKHDGPGGRGRPAHVHVAELPCTYRGVHRAGSGDASAETLGHRYAESAAEALAAAARRGGAAAFLAESMSGCGGQVEFPPGYLQAAFAHARAVGALCIADEVQVGFGRVGSHMWAFETQGVVPDIVTLGKPIGNGHPLAAVVTRPDIAASFANGMEYFNTFGGNPVSSAIGLAVLDVIEDDDLVRHARAVGDHLLAGFRSLQAQFPILGDVRGRGLFLGVEFVRDAATREPAAEALAEVVEQMKEAGFLLSTDGRLHNVLKFKPPMPFSRANADLMLAVFERVLDGLGFRQLES